MKRPFFRYDNPLWAFAGAFLYLLIFSYSTSPLYLSYGTDSPFFQIIGLGMLQGKVPYVDLYDHKGPFIFFINALGYSLGLGKTGLWLLQVLSLSVANIFFYRIARLFVSSDRKAFFATLLSVLPLICFFCEGNQCEEWMLPFESGAVYLVCKHILSGKPGFECGKSAILAAVFSIMFYIRPNDGVMWIGGMYFGLFLIWMVRKEYLMALKNVLVFLAVFAAMTLAATAYFIAHDALDDMFYCMILHNMQYTSEAMFTWGGIGMILIPIIMIGTTLLAEHRRGRNDFLYILLPVLVLTVMFIGKRDYYHYLIPLMPFVVMCYGEALEQGWKVFLGIVSVLFAVFTFRGFQSIVFSLQNRTAAEKFYSQTDALFEMVPLQERNNVWNYNLTNCYRGTSDPHGTSVIAAYLHAGYTPSNVAFEPMQMVFRFSEENGYGIRQCRPEWVLIQDESGFNKDFDYIDSNYVLVGATDSDPICRVRLMHRSDAE